jgi:hypothetical protein
MSPASAAESAPTIDVDNHSVGAYPCNGVSEIADLMHRATAEHLDRHLQRSTNVWRFPVHIDNRLDPRIDRVGNETESLPGSHGGGQRAQMDFCCRGATTLSTAR